MELSREELIQQLVDAKAIFLRPTCNRLSTKVSRSAAFAGSQLGKAVVQATAFLPEAVSMPFRLKALVYGIVKMEACPVCGKPRKVASGISRSVDFFQLTCGSRACVVELLERGVPKKQTAETKAKHAACRKAACQKVLEAAREALAMAKTAPKPSRDQATQLKAAVEDKLVKQVKNGSAVKAADILEKTFVVDLLAATRGY